MKPFDCTGDEFRYNSVMQREVVLHRIIVDGWIIREEHGKKFLTHPDFASWAAEWRTLIDFDLHYPHFILDPHRLLNQRP